jgi:DNA repair exonuclease SbcCD nuclease subunit
MFRFLHAADIHLDSPLRELEQYDGAPVERIRGASRKAFCNLVDLAIAEKVSFVLFAGDLYDGDWKDHNTGLFFARQMSRLREADIPVFIVAGNHDAASQLTKTVPFPSNVHFFSTKKPETKQITGCGVAIHGQGFHTRAVTDDLSTLYPEPIPGLFNIGLLHTSVDGREGHDPYAPCSVNGLLSKQYDYWALGHVHQREILHQEPWIVFPGNIQGRHARETGPKGATLVTVEERRVISVDHHDLDVLRWSVCKIDVSGANSGDEILISIRKKLEQELMKSGSRPIAARIVLVGPCKAHTEISVNQDHWINAIRAVATDLSNGEIWIEKIKFQTQMAVDLEKIIEMDSALGGLLKSIRDIDPNDQIVAELACEFTDLYRKLPAELGINLIDFKTQNPLRAIIPDVQQMLLARLLSAGKQP